jgi:hypothetical protein
MFLVTVFMSYISDGEAVRVAMIDLISHQLFITSLGSGAKLAIAVAQVWSSTPEKLFSPVGVGML